MGETVFVSVDVETSGPAPGRYALLSIGACLVDDPATAFYAELRPDRDGAVPEALAVSGLSLANLAATGLEPFEAMARFAEWLEGAAAGRRPVFVAFNAPFDWLFVAEYFDRYLGRNPFGHSALDVKALYMGATGQPWRASGYTALAARYGLADRLPHHALEDARIQARIFASILAELKETHR